MISKQRDTRKRKRDVRLSFVCLTTKLKKKKREKRRRNRTRKKKKEKQKKNKGEPGAAIFFLLSWLASN